MLVLTEFSGIVLLPFRFSAFCQVRAVKPEKMNQRLRHRGRGKQFAWCELGRSRTRPGRLRAEAAGLMMWSVWLEPRNLRPGRSAGLKIFPTFSAPTAAAPDAIGWIAGQR